MAVAGRFSARSVMGTKLRTTRSAGLLAQSFVGRRHNWVWLGLVFSSVLVVRLLLSPAADLRSSDVPHSPPKATKGFFYQRDIVSDVPWSIHIGRLDLSNPDYELHTTLAQSTVFGLGILSDQVKLLPPEIGRPLAAVSGDFHHNERGPYQGDPIGLQIMQSELVSGPCERTCFWIDAEGNPQMTNVLSRFQITWPGGAVTPFGLNEERTNHGAVLYTPRLGPSTRSSGGRELILERDGDSRWLPLQAGQTYSARVREVREAGDTPLSSNILVLSLSSQLLAEVPKVGPGSILKISTATLPDLNGVKTAIGGGPTLVRDGKTMQWHGPQPRHPRVAVGWNKTNLFLVEVDGRQRALSIGMTFPELADYMVKLGCEEAMNLDGGGSATFWLYGQVANSPSEGKERPLANGLAIVRKDKAAQARHAKPVSD